MSHVHDFDPVMKDCRTCGATAEQIFRGELAHPGRPTSERLWDLRKMLASPTASTDSREDNE